MLLRPILVGLAMSLFSIASQSANTDTSTVKIGDLTIEKNLTYVDKNKITHFYLTWDKLQELSDILAAKILSAQWEFDTLVNMLRGGSLPTRMLLKSLKKSLNIESLHLKSYGASNKQGSIQELVSLELPNNGEGGIFVDDLTDTGNTFNHVKTKFNKAKRVCLLAKPKGIETVDLFGVQVPQDTWIVFPFEQKLEEFLKEKAEASGEDLIKLNKPENDLSFFDRDNNNWIYYSYDKIEKLGDILASKINSAGWNSDTLLSLSQESIVPTLLLSHKLTGRFNIKNLDLGNPKKDPARYVEFLSTLKDGEKVIIVTDTKTDNDILKNLLTVIPRAKLVSFITNPQAISVDHSALETDPKTTIISPYEMSREEFFTKMASY